MTTKVADFIGSYYLYLGGLDVIVFTAGIGENSPRNRSNVIGRVETLGVELDEEANLVRGKLKEISSKNSKVKVFVVPTDEELMIARDTVRLANLL